MFQLLLGLLRFVLNTVLAFLALFVVWLLVQAGPTVFEGTATLVDDVASDFERMSRDAQLRKQQADARVAAHAVTATAAGIAAERAGRRFDQYRAELPADYLELADGRGASSTDSAKIARLANLRAEQARLRASLEFERSLRVQLAERCPDRGLMREIVNPIDAVSCRALRNVLAPDPQATQRALDAIEGDLALLETQLAGQAKRQLEQMAQEEYLVSQALAARLSASERAASARAKLTASVTESQRYAELSETLAEQAERTRGTAESARHGWQSFKSWLWAQFQASWLWILGVLALAFLLPYLFRTIAYYGLMPMIGRLRHLRLSPPESGAAVDVEKAERVARVEIPAGQTLSVRSDCLRPVEPGTSRTRVLYDWSAPLVSIAAGLYGLTEVSAPAALSRPVHASIAPSDSLGADTYIVRVDLEDHPGLVLRPSHLVAVIGDLEVRRRWALGSAHSWATGQLRYIMFSGTGSVFLAGLGDIVAEPLEGTTRQELHGTIVGFDSRLLLSARRTETFLPWLFALRPLVEVGLSGDGVYLWQKTDRVTAKPGVVERSFDVFFGALGKILGF